MTTNTKGERRAGAETRAEILRVALELFTEKGYEGTSVRDISSALGITKSALYYHFENKDAIAASLVEERRAELDDLVDWIAAQPREPGLLRRAALRWVESTTPERARAMRLAHANRPLMRRLIEGGEDVRSGLDRVVKLLVDEDATAEERLYVRMAFDTVGAALLAAQGTGASLDDVISAARRTTVALTRATTRPGRDGPNGPT